MHYEMTNKTICYKEIASLPFLEVGEVIEIFMGRKRFFDCWKLHFSEEINLLKRKEVLWAHPHFRKQETKIKLRLKEELVTLILARINDPNYNRSNQFFRLIPQKPSNLIDINEQILYFAPTEFFLNWALCKDIILPEELQKAFSIKQVPTSKADENQIEIQALAQVLICIEGDKHLTYTSLSERMREFLGADFYYRDIQDKTLRKLISIVHPDPPEKGRPSKNAKAISKQEKINIIPGIIFDDLNGTILIASFKKLSIAIRRIGITLKAIHFTKSLEETLEHPLVLPFLGNNPRLKNFVTYCINNLFL